MKNIYILILLIYSVNIIFAQDSFVKVAEFNGIKEVNEYLQKSGSDLVLKQTKLIRQNVKSGRSVGLHKDNKYVMFYDTLGNLHKKIELTDSTYGEISPDYKHVMLNTGNHPMYPTSFINQYYDHKGNLLFEQESGYRLRTGEIGNFYSIQDESVQDDLVIFDSNGNRISSIPDGMLGAHIPAGGNSIIDFKTFDFFKEGRCLIALDKNGQIQWKFNLNNKITSEMIKINNYQKRIYISLSEKIIVLDYSGNIINDYNLKYNHGSYLGISKNGKYLVALNIKARIKDNFLYLINEKINNILFEKKLADIENAINLHVNVNNDGLILINFRNKANVFKKTILILDKKANSLIKYNYKKSFFSGEEFDIISSENRILIYNGLNTILFER